MGRTPLRIAVIDSGVNPAHPHISRVDGGFPQHDYLDRLGHGTAVMAAIQEKAPGAEYFAVRIFERALSTNINALTTAIEWSIEHRIDIINLSLGTSNPAHAGKFMQFIPRAIFVSAAGVYPGELPGVIRVSPDPGISRDEFRIEKETFYASGYPRPVPGVPPERNLNGASFAVANMAGFVARTCENLRDRSFEAVRRALEAQSRK